MVYLLYTNQPCAWVKVCGLYVRKQTLLECLSRVLHCIIHVYTIHVGVDEVKRTDCMQTILQQTVCNCVMAWLSWAMTYHASCASVVTVTHRPEAIAIRAHTV